MRIFGGQPCISYRQLREYFLNLDNTHVSYFWLFLLSSLLLTILFALVGVHGALLMVTDFPARSRSPRARNAGPCLLSRRCGMRDAVKGRMEQKRPGRVSGALGETDLCTRHAAPLGVRSLLMRTIMCIHVCICADAMPVVRRSQSNFCSAQDASPWPLLPLRMLFSYAGRAYGPIFFSPPLQHAQQA